MREDQFVIRDPVSKQGDGVVIEGVWTPIMSCTYRIRLIYGDGS